MEINRFSFTKFLSHPFSYSKWFYDPQPLIKTFKQKAFNEYYVTLKRQLERGDSNFYLCTYLFSAKQSHKTKSLISKSSLSEKEKIHLIEIIQDLTF